ncbi:MAG: hypothetical protein HYY18_12300, partial [Planctomycetes bacterium]|nr:hypothetical protein [Planctomycetota bacterium]
ADPVEASPLGDLVAEEVFRFVGASVAALPPAYRRTVEMRFFESLPVAGIARALGVPVGTVKARLSRAPDMLRQTLSVQATTARFVLGVREKSGNPATFPRRGGKKEMEAESD